MLELVNVSRSFDGPKGRVAALENVTLAVKAGELVSVQGPSGCGKTTLLLIAGAMLKPETGRVCVDGSDPYALPASDRGAFRSAKLGFVFQQFHLIPYLHVLDNVLVPSVARPDAGARERAMGLLQRFGLEDRIHHLPAQLSSGERQRAALARALLNNPSCILADEPTGNLDRANGEIVFRHLAEFAEQGGAVLVVTHDDLAAAFARRTVRMQKGRLEA